MSEKRPSRHFSHADSKEAHDEDKTAGGTLLRHHHSPRHLLIVISLLFPYAHSLGEPPRTGWQVLFPSPDTLALHLLDPFYLSLIVARAFTTLMVLALPPLASVAVSRSPRRMMGLLGVWISLPLTLLSCLVCAYTALTSYATLLTTSPAVWLPPLGFALSFISCLVLALYLPLLRAREPTRGAVSRPAHLEAGQHERAERVSPSHEEQRPEQAIRPRRRSRLAFIGLLCHLVIGLSLLFPYTELYDPYAGANSRTTGWQLLGSAFQTGIFLTVVALLLLAALVVPILIYLACLLPFPRKSDQRAALLLKGAYLNYLLTTMGFSLSLVVLLIALILRGGDYAKQVLTIDLAFVIPSAAFLLSLLCSTVLSGSGLQLRTGGS